MSSSLSCRLSGSSDLLRIALLSSALLSAAGCTVESPAPDVGRSDAPSIDVRANDAPPMTCTSAAECDDGVACTFDDCIVGNVCDHMPLDSLCTGGDHCDRIRGCIAGCTTAADCNTGINYCDGTFACAGGDCVRAEPRSCDDGNACTTDTCDPSVVNGDVEGGCVYAIATGCDGGVGSADAGLPTCDPFDPATGYTGTFRMAPVLSLDCIENYSITSFTFSAAGGRLTVSGSPSFGATLTGALPTGADFTVTGSTSCGDYTLTGRFVCESRFSGTFTSSFSGECAICGGGSTMVVGRI